MTPKGVRRRGKPKQRRASDKLSRAVAVRQELQRLITSVRNKYKELRRSSEEMRESMEIGAKPFIAPLQKAVVEGLKPFAPKLEPKTETKKEEEEEEEEEDLNKTIEISTQTEAMSLPEKYLDRMSNPAYRDKFDSTYGVRVDGKGGTTIGNSKVSFSKYDVFVRERTFPATRGLLELMFMKVPNKAYLNREDLAAYKDILLLTNAHRQMYSSEKHINANKGAKYTSVISALFKPRLDTSTASTSTTGSGVQFTSYNKDVNTLVNRLRLLVSSQSAGHTGHKEEIERIIVLLRKNKIIA